MKADSYSTIAPCYDRVTEKYLNPVRVRIGSLCACRRWQRILDIGCGTGVLAFDLAFQGRQVVGVDASPAMLEQASEKRKNCLPSVAKRLEFMSLNAAQLAFSSAAFDVATLVLVLHETAASKEEILLHALNAAPRVIVVDWRIPERNMDYLWVWWVHLIERLAGKEHYRHFREFCREGGVRGVVQRCGVRVVAEEVVCQPLSLYVVEK